MTRIQTIQNVVERRLCIGCGACVALLGSDTAEMVDIPSLGLCPVFKRSLSREEDAAALSVCPGIRVEAPQTRDAGAETDPVVGPTAKVWVGHATEPEVRWKGSSGGVLTALSLYSLERKGVDFVAHTCMDEDEPWKIKNTKSRSREDLLATTGSRYAPSSPCELFPDIASTPGKAVFIGKPCDVAALKLTMKSQPDLEERVDTVLTFFCAGTPSSESVRRLAEAAVGSDVKRLSSLHFRGDGWPGYFRMGVEKGRIKSYYSYEESWGQLQRTRGLRCHLCADGMGDLADVACGDAWHLHTDNDNPGLSVVIARTEKGKRLVEDAERAGYLTLYPSDAGAVLQAQGSDSGIAQRRRVVWGRLAALAALGVPRPRYTGMPLFAAWIELPLTKRCRSVIGTVSRVFKRRLYKRELVALNAPAEGCHTASKPSVTFVLPGRGPSGGVRATVEMGNELRSRGYRVRIAYPRLSPFTRAWLRWTLDEVLSRLSWSRRIRNDWVQDFEGPLLAYRKTQRIELDENEVVVAVGTKGVLEMQTIASDASRRVRYCHGFSDHDSRLTEWAWGGSMPTIAVSALLADRIEHYSGSPPIHIVPNGIRRSQYFVEHHVRRDGIGLVYSSNPKKSPAHAQALAHAISEEFPDIPLCAFGADRRPSGFPDSLHYWRKPVVSQSRWIYNRSLIWLVVSKSEGFCLPILEAMACGTAVISTDHDTARGLVHPGENGLLVPVGSTEAFLAEIRSLLNDPAQRRRLVSNGYRTVQKYSWERATDAMETALGRLNAITNSRQAPR